MIVILIVYIIRVRIYQRNLVGIGHITKEFPFLSVIKKKKKESNALVILSTFMLFERAFNMEWRLHNVHQRVTNL